MDMAVLWLCVVIPPTRPPTPTPVLSALPSSAIIAETASGRLCILNYDPPTPPQNSVLGYAEIMAVRLLQLYIIHISCTLYKCVYVCIMYIYIN